MTMTKRKTDCLMRDEREERRLEQVEPLTATHAPGYWFCRTGIGVVPDSRSKRYARIHTFDEVEECGACDHYHPKTFNGDCRDDANRLVMRDDGTDNLISYAEQNRLSAKGGNQ